MWICVVHRKSFLLRRRLCLVVCLALAVITLTETPPATAHDIVRDVNQGKNLELYYAAVTTVIPTAVTSVLKDQLVELSQQEEEDEEEDGDEETKRRENSRHVKQTTNAAAVDSVHNGPLSKVNERTYVVDDETTEEQKAFIYRTDDEVSNSDKVTKDITNTHDHGERTTNRSNNRRLIALDVMQQDIDVTSLQRTLLLPLETVSGALGNNNNNNINANDAGNLIYDFDNVEQETGDESEEEDNLSVRVRKDTSNMEGVTWESLQRLAEFATASNPDWNFNLVTPNPDIEITIEVLPVVGSSSDGAEYDLANEVTQTKSPAGGRKGKGNKKGKGKKNKKNKDRTRTGGSKDTGDSEESNPVPNIPSRKQENASAEEETNKPVDNGEEEEESSYSYHIGGALLPFIPDDFEDFNFAEDTYPMEEGGEWTVWSICTATCGGGRTERSRSCGFSCTATETQDCNQHACPEIEYLDSQIIAGVQPVVTSSPTVQTTDELFRYLDPSLTDFTTDSCEEWMSCKSETLMSYLSRLEDLPSCPCFYPTSLHVNDMLWDKVHRKMFRWMVSDNVKERLDVYKHSAKYCIRSLLTAHSTSLAAQQCCYDEETMRLITRGPGAGTPKLISREISLELNYKIDILPWIICRGDWSKYNAVRQPNNGRECRDFPADDIYTEYLEELSDF